MAGRHVGARTSGLLGTSSSKLEAAPASPGPRLLHGGTGLGPAPRQSRGPAPAQFSPPAGQSLRSGDLSLSPVAASAGSQPSRQHEIWPRGQISGAGRARRAGPPSQTRCFWGPTPRNGGPQAPLTWCFGPSKVPKRPLGGPWWALPASGAPPGPPRGPGGTQLWHA